MGTEDVLPQALQFSFNTSASGEIELDYPLSNEQLPAYISGAPFPPTSPEHTVRWLMDTYLTLKFAPTPEFLSQGGHSWIPRIYNPTLWTEPFDPPTSIEPLLPQSYATQTDTHLKVGFQELTVTDQPNGLGSVTALRRKRHARQGTREFVRGKTGAVPFMPGGEAWNTLGNPATSAAATEAASMAWLQELESGNLPMVSAPGLDKGAFGPWSRDGSNADDREDGVDLGELQAGLEAVSLTEPQHDQEQQHPIDSNIGGDGGAGSKSINAAEATKAAINDLFCNVWMLESTADSDNEDEDQEDDADKKRKVTTSNGTATTIAAIPSKTRPTSSGIAAIDALVNLPSVEDLPGGVSRPSISVGEGSVRDVDETFAALSSIPQAEIWNRKPGSSPLKKARKDAEWAVKGTVRNLDVEFAKLKPGMAKSYPFELDVFQKEAIIHMEQGHSVFVAAHTSAGKTVAAEYAFALATKHCTRAVYTSPIKTISNQKFRDFSGQFEVGLLTGDVSIKPESPCLIMTTEILRSMLYKGADVIRDIEWVIFDEVHYVNDAERGVVWEEVIIMLPEHVGLVLLSATVPNVMEFADWVGRTKRKVVYVTGTTKRPVPLEHNLYYGGQLYTIATADVLDPKGFIEARKAHAKRTNAPQTKTEAKAALPTGRGNGPGRGGRGGLNSQQQQRQYIHRSTGPSSAQMALRTGMNAPGGGGPQLRSEKSQWSALIETLRKKDLIPMVVFCFSKKRCDALADTLQSLDLTSASEKSEIHVFCDKALSRLKGGDRELPQVLRLREMLKRGLGVHHAGLLPIVKEMVEMLFCRGVIKVLFSTETFAMGVNAPARTVVFQSLRKHDGKQFRTILPGEYTQMAGRAGRRGIDAVGTVIIACWEDLPEETDIRRLLTGAATKLESQFRLTYSMILNLLRVEDLTVEDMMKRSFAEFHAQKAQPEVQEALRKGQEALKRLRRRPWPASPLGTTREDVEQYYTISAAIEQLDARLQGAITGSRGAQQALTNGRVVLVANPSTGVTEIGVVIDAAADSLGGSGGGGKGKRRGVGLGLDSLSSSSTSVPASASGESGGTRIVLQLHRASPLDDAASISSVSAMSSMAPLKKEFGSEIEGIPPVLSGGGFKVLGKKKDDDDFFMGMKPVGKGAKSLGGGSGGGFDTFGFSGKSAIASSSKPTIPLPHKGSIGGLDYKLHEVPVSQLPAICKMKIKVEMDEILVGDAMGIAAAVHALVKVKEEAAGEGGDPAVMDPIVDLKLNSIELVSDVRERSRLAALRAELPAHRDPALPEMLAMVRSEGLLAARMAALAKQTGDAGLQQLPEFHQRVKVLQHMGYLDANRIVTMKGRVACEINSGDELVATELIFGGVLSELSPEEAVALLSALVFQEKTDVQPELSPRLEQAREDALALALNAGIIQKDHELDILPEDFVMSTLKFGLSEVVYEWAKGTPFKDICGLTDIMEGSVVRAMVRLDETCREFRDAARVMGNTTLFKQMEEASVAIKRDVIFAASLYVA